MTDKQFIETLKGIKTHCEMTHCKYCEFRTENFSCQITALGYEIQQAKPCYWDISKIERVING